MPASSELRPHMVDRAFFPCGLPAFFSRAGFAGGEGAPASSELRPLLRGRAFLPCVAPAFVLRTGQSFPFRERLLPMILAASLRTAFSFPDVVGQKLDFLPFVFRETHPGGVFRIVSERTATFAFRAKHRFARMITLPRRRSGDNSNYANIRPRSEDLSSLLGT